MSGGSYNYVYIRIQELAQDISIRAKTPERKAFARLLLKVSKAAHDIEWVDSGDYGSGRENESILDALGENHKFLVMKELIEEAEGMVKTLNEYINSAKNTIS
jgi:hypothetical protein